VGEVGLLQTNKNTPMHKNNFSTTLFLNQTPAEVFNAICNVDEWWTGEPGVEGRSGKVGDEFTYRYRKIHYSKQRITELIPEKKIVWLVTESELTFVNDTKEWTGTSIVFEIGKKGDKTELRFTHAGLVSNMECYADCSNAWSSYINNSLNNYIRRLSVATP
jgi:hypothetical protein